MCITLSGSVAVRAALRLALHIRLILVSSSQLISGKLC